MFRRKGDKRTRYTTGNKMAVIRANVVGGKSVLSRKKLNRNDLFKINEAESEENRNYFTHEQRIELKQL